MSKYCLHVSSYDNIRKILVTIIWEFFIMNFLNIIISFQSYITIHCNSYWTDSFHRLANECTAIVGLLIFIGFLKQQLRKSFVAGMLV